MKKRRLSLVFFLGAGLILCGLCLALVFGLRVSAGSRHSPMVVSSIEQVLPEKTQGIPELYPNSGMPVLEIDGTDYVALLEIPAFGLTLPVADQWDRLKLSQSPARFWGSAYDHTLVIGGTDSAQQFGFCDKIEHGTLVILTDMTGAQFAYTVTDIDRAKHAETHWLTDADCDLTLFCHDLYAMEYLAVRCVFAYNEQGPT